jgi:hypothetical protein
LKPRRRFALGVSLALIALPGLSVTPVGAADELLPDLKMAPIYNITVERSAAGRKKLRFGTIVWNVGQGPLEVHADTRSGPFMTNLGQWITTIGGGGYLSPRPGAIAFYSTDGHDHWHIQRFVIVTLYRSPVDGEPSPTPGGPTFELRTLRKIGFCLTDLVRVPAALRPVGSPARIGYPVRGCGVRASTSLRMGISVGFGDDYKPFFAHQAVDVTGLAEGTYRLCATVNGDGMWHEIDNVANNSSWVDLALNPATRRVSVVGQGESACAPPPLFYGVGA